MITWYKWALVIFLAQRSPRDLTSRPLHKFRSERTGGCPVPTSCRWEMPIWGVDGPGFANLDPIITTRIGGLKRSWSLRNENCEHRKRRARFFQVSYRPLTSTDCSKKSPRRLCCWEFHGRKTIWSDNTTGAIVKAAWRPWFRTCFGEVHSIDKPRKVLSPIWNSAMLHWNGFVQSDDRGEETSYLALIWVRRSLVRSESDISLLLPPAPAERLPDLLK